GDIGGDRSVAEHSIQSLVLRRPVLEAAANAVQHKDHGPVWMAVDANSGAAAVAAPRASSPLFRGPATLPRVARCGIGHQELFAPTSAERGALCTRRDTARLQTPVSWPASPRRPAIAAVPAPRQPQ